MWVGSYVRISMGECANHTSTMQCSVKRVVVTHAPIFFMRQQIFMFVMAQVEKMMQQFVTMRQFVMM